MGSLFITFFIKSYVSSLDIKEAKTISPFRVIIAIALWKIKAFTLFSILLISSIGMTKIVSPTKFTLLK